MFSNERPYECTICMTSFGRKGGLRRHNIMKHSDFVYACPYEECTHPGFKCSKVWYAMVFRLSDCAVVWVSLMFLFQLAMLNRLKVLYASVPFSGIEARLWIFLQWGGKFGKLEMFLQHDGFRRILSKVGWFIPITIMPFLVSHPLPSNASLEVQKT